MPTLLLLNGAPASGKSTLAELLAEQQRFTLVVDIDTIRGSISGWEAEPVEAGLMARRLALGMCSTHLSAGHDVVVPQFLQREEFITELASAAEAVGAEFLEVCLVNSPETAAAQFAARATSADPNHRAAELLQSAAEASPIEDLYATMLAMVSNRPGTVLVESILGDIELSLKNLLAALDTGSTGR